MTMEFANDDEPQQMQRSTGSVNEERSLETLVRMAKKSPRSIEVFKASCTKLATTNEETAEQCMYALPRDGKMITGPSVRLAEIILNEWGNCAGGGGTDYEDADFVYARGYFFDAQRIVRVDRVVRRRITGRYGRYSADMIAQTANAATSIAARNATLAGIPRAYWEEVYQAVRKKVAGDIATLETRRATAIEWMARRGVEPIRILAALNVPSIETITLEHLADLKGMINAIQTGEASVDEMFPAPAGRTSSTSKGVTALKEKLASEQAEPPVVDVRADVKADTKEPLQASAGSITIGTDEAPPEDKPLNELARDVAASRQV